MIHYFAFGSNLDVTRLQLRGFHVINLNPGMLKDWELKFNVSHDPSDGIGYANISPKKGAYVEGLIFETDVKSMKNLDDYEEYPILYLKKNVKVINSDGLEINCVTYVANPQKTKDGLKPTKDYLELILKGKKYLSEKYYDIIRNAETIKQ